MPPLPTTTRPATPDDVRDIIAISRRVQDRLNESGSLQQSGPLSSTLILDRIRDQRCFVICLSNNGQIIGLSMVKPIEANYYPQSRDFDVESFPAPWKLLHSFMLDSPHWGQSYGLQLFQGTVDFIEATRCAGTLLLDCWAGNEKLKEFYMGCGCLYMGTVPEEDWHVSVFARFLAPGPVDGSDAMPWASPNPRLMATAPVNTVTSGVAGLLNGAERVNGINDITDGVNGASDT